MNSILTSIKKLLGITEDYDQFDVDIITHINAVFLMLFELSDNDILLGAVKSYMYLKVKLLFDPSLTSSVTELMKEQAKELEWRMNVLVDPSDTFEW